MQKGWIIFMVAERSEPTKWENKTTFANRHGMKPDDDSIKWKQANCSPFIYPRFTALQIHRFVKFISRRLNYLRVANAGGSRQAGRRLQNVGRIYIWCALSVTFSWINIYRSWPCAYFSVLIFLRKQPRGRVRQSKMKKKSNVNSYSYSCEWSVCSLESITFIRL